MRHVFRARLKENNMKEIHCKHCGRCLSKDIILGAGMFYINPSKVFNLFSEVRKCPNCGAYNKIDIELGMRVKVAEVEN